MAEQADLSPGTLDLLILKSVSLDPQHGYGVLIRIQQIIGGALLSAMRAHARWSRSPVGYNTHPNLRATIWRELHI